MKDYYLELGRVFVPINSANFILVLSFPRFILCLSSYL